jgi:hypothetical protein
MTTIGMDRGVTASIKQPMRLMSSPLRDTPSTFFGPISTALDIAQRTWAALVATPPP